MLGLIGALEFSDETLLAGNVKIATPSAQNTEKCGNIFNNIPSSSLPG